MSSTLIAVALTDHGGVGGLPYGWPVRRVKGVVLGIAAAIAITPGAYAASVGDDISAQPEVVRALADARAYWHGAAPACPAIGVTVVAEADPDVMASAAACAISVNADWLAAAPDRTRYCALFAHEYGHLLGYGHAAYPQDVDKVMVTRGTPAYCRTFNARATLPKVCSWPKWARATPAVRRLYAAGKRRAARRAYLKWRTRHRRAVLTACRLSWDEPAPAAPANQATHAQTHGARLSAHSGDPP